MAETLTIQPAEIKANSGAQRRTLDGRTHLVAPLVALVAGVVNGELVTREELAAFAEAWNGRPVPLRHPLGEGGAFVSANSPAVIEASVVGQVFGMHVEGDRLLGEMWIDEEKCNRLGGAALDALKRIEAGEVVEVSTAYFCDIEPEVGKLNGKRYHAVQHNLRPDHIALLPDEIGACSVADGCGVGRTNQVRGNADLNFTRAVMVAFYLRPEDAQGLALAADALPGGSVTPAEELHITLAYLGEIEEAEIEFGRVAQVLAEQATLQPVVLATVSGAGRFTAAEGDLDALVALVDSEEMQRFRFWLADVLMWDVGADVSRRWAYIPHVTLGYAPAGDVVTLPAVARMALVLDRLALSWGGETVEFPLLGNVRERATAPAAVINCRCSGGTMNEQEKQQAKMTKAGGGMAANEEEAAIETRQVEERAGEGAPGSTAPAAVPDELRQLAEAVRAFGGVGALMEAVQGIKANNDRQKAQSVARLAANSRCAFSASDLEAMSLEQLAKLEASLTPVMANSYVGRNGAAMAANVGEELRPARPPKSEKKA